jgi:pimeloyl-ACP methyl ester carboxylesterase
MPQTRYDFGGDGPVLHLAVANGFPPRTYQPLLAPLTARCRVLSFPPRALWADPPPPTSVHSWADLASDLLDALRAERLEPVIGVGHSFGGVVTLAAAVREPQRFRALILLDPTIFMPGRMFMLRVVGALGLRSRMPMVRGALNRRARFASLDEAYAYWRGKRLFRDWTDDALRLYAESLTRPLPDEQGVTLTWSPQWEARFYQTIQANTWRDVRRVRGKLPVLAIRGGLSDTFTQPAAAKLKRLLPDAQCAVIDGHGHLFPHTAPEMTQQLIADWLQSQRLWR